MSNANSKGLRTLKRVFLRKLNPAAVEFSDFHMLVTCIDEVANGGDIHHQPSILEETRNELREKGYNAFCLRDLQELFENENLSVVETAAVSNAILIIQTNDCDSSISEPLLDTIEMAQLCKVSDNSDLRIHYFEPVEPDGDKPLAQLLDSQFDMPNESVHQYDNQDALTNSAWKQAKNVIMRESDGTLAPFPGNDDYLNNNWETILNQY